MFETPKYLKTLPLKLNPWFVTAQLWNLLFGYEVKTLQRLGQCDYVKAGILCNPYYFYDKDCRNKPTFLFSIREQAIKDIMRLMSSGKCVYISGHGSGSGKTILLNELSSNLVNQHYTILTLRNIVRHKYPISAVQFIRDFLDNTLKHNKTKCRVAIFDEVEFEELYDYFLKNNWLILGGGHYFARDTGECASFFVDIDIDRTYPISISEKINYLSTLLIITGVPDLVSKGCINKIVKNTPTTGMAEAVMGSLLATYAKRFLENKNPKITKQDIFFWLSVIGTNWFWYSMDCWRTPDCLTPTLKFSSGAETETISLKIKISSKLERKKEND